MTGMYAIREITWLRRESLENTESREANETAVQRYFQKNDMILLKVVNNILDETRFSFR